MMISDYNSFVEWKKKESEKCTTMRLGSHHASMEQFDSVAEAKKHCLQEEKCYKISDLHCSRVTYKSFGLCIRGSSEESHWNGGCTYEKPGSDWITHICQMLIKFKN